MDEDLILENALFPWLETDVMADETYSDWVEFEEEVSDG